MLGCLVGYHFLNAKQAWREDFWRKVQLTQTAYNGHWTLPTGFHRIPVILYSLGIFSTVIAMSLQFLAQCIQYRRRKAAVRERNNHDTGPAKLLYEKNLCTQVVWIICNSAPAAFALGSMITTAAISPEPVRLDGSQQGPLLKYGTITPSHRAWKYLSMQIAIALTQSVMLFLHLMKGCHRSGSFLFPPPRNETALKIPVEPQFFWGCCTKRTY